MTKTWSQRILNAAQKEDTINTSTLRKRFRIPRTEMDPITFDGTVMRTVRRLAENGSLNWVYRGTYKITRQGKKAIN